jgi:hypothetical protein
MGRSLKEDEKAENAEELGSLSMWDAVIGFLGLVSKRITWKQIYICDYIHFIYSRCEAIDSCKLRHYTSYMM